MKTLSFVLSLLSVLLVLSSVVEAWSWTDEFEGLIYGRGEVLKKRADDGEFDARSPGFLWKDTDSNGDMIASSTESAAKETGSASATATGDTAAATVTGTASGTGTITQAASTGTDTQATTGSNTKSATGTKKTSSSSVSINSRDPAGGISMITPAADATSSYYKIGNWVTFAWNYTSLSVTPSAVDVLASCSANDHYYTIALNETVGPTNEVLWDTGAYQSSATVPLLTETYTLVIYDAASEISATASPGYLATYDTYAFAMYSPQAYTPLNGMSFLFLLLFLEM